MSAIFWLVVLIVCCCTLGPVAGLAAWIVIGIAVGLLSVALGG